MKQATFEVNRLSALSDGVFAIALTLLVLDLKLPAQNEANSDMPLEEALLNQLPHFLSWILSFAILARLWIVQHALLVGGGKRSRSFMAWNFLFLATVSVLPFTASLIAEHPHHALSTFVFSSVLAIGGIAVDRMWSVEHAVLSKQAEHDSSVSSPRSSTILMLIVALISSAVAIFYPSAAPVIWVAYPLLAPFVRR